MNRNALWLAGIAVVTLGSCNNDRGGSGRPAVLTCAVARVVQSSGDLVPGRLARGTAGDLVIENDRIRVIVQKGGRNWFNIAEFGGNIIDAVPKNANGTISARDNFEEHALGTNIESSPNYQQVRVLSPGGRNAAGACQPAVIRATGPDDLLDFVNGSSAIRDLGLFFPPSADDKDLPVDIQTDYTLDVGKRYLKVETTLFNRSAPQQEQRVYFVEYLNGSGEVEVFQHGYGFGEAFVTAPCTGCNYVVYAGHEGGTGVSYGFIHNYANSSSVSVSGVTVIVYGRDTLLLATTPENLQAGNPNSQPNFVIPANGSVTLTRYFAVGDGTVASVLDSRNEILKLATGTLAGVVTNPAGPVEGAEIAVLTASSEGFPSGRGPSLKVVNHFRTAPDGSYGGTLPPGTYTLRINMPGRNATMPATSVTIAAGATTSQNFALPAAARIRVTVVDAQNRAIPAKVQLIRDEAASGTDTSPDATEPMNCESVLGGQLIIRTGVFGDIDADNLPQRANRPNSCAALAPPSIALAEFAVLDDGAGPVAVGDTGEHVVEPGTYQVSVSRGLRHAEFVQNNVVVREGELTTVTATLAEVVPTSGYVFADFHVHSFDSPDAEVTNRERVATYVAEDMDFFAASDHDIRVDFRPVIADMGLEGWVATTPSAEVTTFDYGHFNFWPVGIEAHSPDSELPGEGHSHDAKVGRGATDWGGMAPLGKDFPSAGHYVLPPQEIFESAGQDPFDAGRTVVRQINHVDSHFGAAGLRIDTGQTPPKSSASPAAKRLDPGYVNPDLGGNNYFGLGFHTLEVWIGTDGFRGQTTVFIDQNMGDWFNMLNQGIRRTGISNSDTHERRITALFTRNMISVPSGLLSGGRAAPLAIAADPHTVGDSVRAGRTTMTGGPILTVKARNAAGQVAGLELGDAFGVASKPLPLAAPNETVQLEIDVKSATWGEYDQILVFTNGHTVRHTNQAGQPTSPARYRLCAPAQRFDEPAGFARSRVTVPGTGGAERFETTKTVGVTAPGGVDYWMMVMVRGTQGKSRPMWPVVPNSFVESGSLLDRSTADRGTYALAVSNPIFVDADNDGTWEPPGVLTHQGTTLPPDPCPGGTMPAP